MMPGNNDALERVAQAERRQKLEQKREAARHRKTNTSRRIKIGEMVEKHFPEVLQIQPKFKKQDNDLEFAPLDDFLATLAGDKELMEQIKARSRGE